MSEASTTLLCVPARLLDRTWPLVESMIDDAYRHRDLLMPDVLTWLKEEKGLLWVATAPPGERILAACTTSLVLRRSGLSCRIMACGGEGIDLWIERIQTIEDYARREGCVKIWFEGREGWGAFLPGYKPRTIMFERRL